MTHMVNAMDRSYADQSTLHGEDPMAVTFMDSHNYNNRCGLQFCCFESKYSRFSVFAWCFGTLEDGKIEIYLFIYLY